MWIRKGWEKMEKPKKLFLREFNHRGIGKELHVKKFWGRIT